MECTNTGLACEASFGSNKPVRGVAAIAFALFLCLCVAVRPALAADMKHINRLGGKDRYDTMSSIVSEGFAQSSWAVVATGQNYPDALSASALAGALDCPVILTSGNSLSSQAREELTRLEVTSVYLMGGVGAVSDSVESAIAAMSIDVTRIEGENRTDTSIKAMEAVRVAGSEADTVIIATGSSFADSLSIGPWSYYMGAPIVLASNGVLSADAVDAIQADPYIKNVLIVGGTSAVKDSIKAQLGEDAYSFERLYGENRYATSKSIAEWETAHGLGWTAPTVATGQNFPDAIAGVSLCGVNASPLLLTSATSYEAIELVGTNAQYINRCYVLGGTSAVSIAKSIVLFRALNDMVVPPAFAVDSWTTAYAGTNELEDCTLWYVESNDGKSGYLMYVCDDVYWDFLGSVTRDDDGMLKVTDYLQDLGVGGLTSYEFKITGTGSDGEMLVDLLDEHGVASLYPLDVNRVWNAMALIAGVPVS